ncbi:preprotein translocase subunit SecE [Undibacterium sp.]|uniref:preprotein translocase subunit SecE n=1 Tax=Undibacterium sp. TaxID=1914977 RepID=UPI0025CCAFD0|nr:preprotein translocase subunit SecE [Undibacterium sp.]
MSNQPVQTVGNSSDKLKVILAVVALVAGIVGFYILSDKPTYVRAGVLVAGILIGIALAWTSTSGKDFINFSRESIRETKKVVWPTRREALQITLIVFGFVLLMAMFLWGTDKLLEFLLYDVILGWKK